MSRQRSAFIGGRPYTSDDDARYFQREVESARLIDIVTTTPVSALLAASGVGKTSLLQAGLEAKLGDRVGVLRTWTAIDEHAPYASAVAQAFHGVLPDGERWTEPWDVLDAIQDLVGDGFVIVFDQFESLLRYSPLLAERLMEEIGRLVRDDEPPVHHVLSLRSEFRQQLRPLERLTRVSAIEVEPLGRDRLVASLRQLGQEGARVASPSGEERHVTVEGSVTDLLAKIAEAADRADWSSGLASRSSAEVSIGALHLQVLHETLWFEALQHRPDLSVLTSDLALEVLESMGRDTEGDLQDPQRATAIVQDSFHRSLQRALGGDEEAERDRYIVAAIGMHLSVQGYKVARRFSDLRDAVFSEESILIPGLVDAWPKNGAAALGDTDDVAPTVAEDHSRDNRNGWAWHLSAGQIANHLSASFERVVQKLRDADVLRAYQPMDSSDVIVELVHDGWGRPFEAWARDLMRSPRWNVERAVATLGEDIEGDLTASEVGIADGALPPLRWKGCWLERYEEPKRLRIEGLTFEGCDFGGTGFEGVDLVDVTFRDCNMEGALFNRCEFQGVRFEETRPTKEPQLSAMIVRDSRLTDLGETAALTFQGLGEATARIQSCRMGFIGPGGRIDFVASAARQLALTAVKDSVVRSDTTGPLNGEGQEGPEAVLLTLDRRTSGSQLLLEGSLTLVVTGASVVDQSIARPNAGGTDRPSITLGDPHSTIGVVQFPSAED